MTTATPSKIDLLQYSFLALPLAFAGLPLYIHAPDFYTRDLGMNIGMIGVILLAVRLFDAFQDPIIGYISDQKPTQRFGLILSGTLALIIGMGALFYGPQMSIPISWWFAGSMILATTGFSIITINLTMIGGFWHSSAEQRTRISGWRESFALIGLLVASILPAALQTTQTAQDSFQALFWTFGFLIVIAFIFFTRFMQKISTAKLMKRGKSSVGFSFFNILSGRDKAFFAVCFLAHLAAALPGVMVLFFIRDYLGAESLSGLFLFLYFISGAALMSVWIKLADHIGQEKAWLCSMLLAVVSFIWTYALNPGDTLGYGLICILSGTALGGNLALPPAILAKRINQHNKESDATQYYALLAFLPKTAVALASGVTFLILDRIGFTPGTDNTDSALSGLIIIYALVPCIIKLMAAGLLWFTIKTEGYNHENTERSVPHGTTNIS